MHLLGISGSLRAASLNTQLLLIAAEVFGADTFTQADLNLPLYNGDLEADGVPESVQTLSDQIAAADAVIIATPEYNKNLPGVLKNALDWVSRTDGKPWNRKPVAIMSATAGRAGGERAQNSLRLCLQPFNADVLGQPEVLVGGAMKEIADGALVSESYQKALQTQMDALKAMVK